jgi:hypothetical protein
MGRGQELRGHVLRGHQLLLCLAGCALTGTVWSATEVAPGVSIGGFIRAEYGAGDRYPEARGEDRLGVSKAALAVTAEREDIRGVFVAGTERLTDGNPDNNGDIDIKDVFIVIGANQERGWSGSFGVQPLLIGLKPNGYPGDRSLQPSIEYGGAGAFAVSNQAGPSLIGTYKFNPTMSLRFGAFDLDADNTGSAIPPDEGSKLIDNLFVQWRGDQLFGSPLYASVSLERIYVGGFVDDSQTIATAGVGYRSGMFDVSLELIRLDQEIVGAADDESYVVAEFTFNPNERWTAYADVAQADELDAMTYRVGAVYQLRKFLSLSLELSNDDFDTPGFDDADSVDLRLTFTY